MKKRISQARHDLEFHCPCCGRRHSLLIDDPVNRTRAALHPPSRHTDSSVNLLCVGCGWLGMTREAAILTRAHAA